MREKFNALPPYLQATVFGLMASISAAIFSVFVRLATELIDPLQAVFFRNLFGLILIAPLAFRSGITPLKTKRLPMFLLRAVLSMGAMSFWFSALAYLPLAEATTLNFTVPLFGTVLAAIFLGEKVRQYRVAALLVGFGGVLIIIRPGAETMQMASLFPIAAAVCMASAGLTIKSLSRTENPTTIILYMMALTTPLTLIPALFVWETPSVDALLLMAAGAFMANITQLCNTNAFRVYDYGFVIGFNYLRLPFVLIIALVMFGEVPEIWLLPGAGLIIGSALFIARREAKLAKEANRIKRGPSAAATDIEPPSKP
ncbi:MAG: DMT family transporter [Thalassospira sp.]|uniref:DMT family transporter n=1 Tax=Thalassospira sp. TaxID=1912094 RepID=UPI0032EC9463